MMQQDITRPTPPRETFIRVDEICDAFEEAWRAGQQPRIEDYVTHDAGVARGELLRELLLTEWELGKRDGPSCQVEDCKARFPDHQELIVDLYRRWTTSTAESTRPDTSDRAAGSSGLNVRCPNCHQLINLETDNSISDVRCSACGSHFSLINEPVEVRTIGHFELVERLGRGAFGVVWKARDTKLDRIVAIKIPRKGLADLAEIEKFVREARTAAQLRHPNIVPVHEIGRDGDIVYIVSDLVNGVSLAEWLPRHPMTARESAELCAKLADALHHAHEAGVIHRDLKPHNILLDSRREPHVTDFGLARRETGEVTVTKDGDVLGTPAYMSPEQARGESHQADRRTDVYSSGVILFQLLTGELPFRGATHSLIQSVIHDEPPHPRQLNSSIPRNLATICLKAMARVPAHRYATARELADDLQRYLRGEPVHARPPRVWERCWRWARRRPALGFVLLALVAGIVGTTSGLVRAQHALAREAKQAEAERQAKQEALVAAEAEKKAKQTAETREAESRAVLDFVTNRIFAAARPEGVEGGLGRDVTLRQALNAVLPSLEDAFKDQPLIEAKLRMTLGLSYDLLGEDTLAHDQIQAAHTLYSRHAAPDDQDSLWSANLLAETYSLLGRHAEAAKLHEETLALRRAKLGPTHFDTLFSMHSLAGAYHGLGRMEEALRLTEETLALEKANLGVDHKLTLSTMGNLAQSYLAVGRHADALRLNEETLALRRSTLGPDHPYTLWSMNNLAETYFKMGRYAEALKRGKETLALRQAKLGPDHRETLMSMQIVADSYAQLGQGADAIKHYEALLSQWEKKLGADHREIADRCIRLAWCLAFSPGDAQTHDHRRAVALAERGVKLAPEEGGYWRTLGVAHYRAGDWQAAVTALDKAISLDKGEDDWWCLNWTFLAMAHWQMGNKDEARKYSDQATKWIEKRDTGDIVLRHFQDEAAELLGIKDGIRK